MNSSEGCNGAREDVFPSNAPRVTEDALLAHSLAISEIAEASLPGCEVVNLLSQRGSGAPQLQADPGSKTTL